MARDHSTMEPANVSTHEQICSSKGREPRRENSTKAAYTRPEYAKAVRALAHAKLHSTTFPAKEYEDLADFLDPVPGSRRRRSSVNQYTNQISHGVLYSYKRGASREIKKTFVDAQACADSLDENLPASQVLFLRGYSNPEWLTTIAAKCRTDPEFLASNMLYRCREQFFSYPSLPSSYDDIVRLRVPTIGVWAGGTSRSSKSAAVQKLRMDSEDRMGDYLHQLKTSRGINLSQSIVRDFHVLDEQRFVIEQEISVCLQRSEDGFLAWVCQDAGNSLSEGLAGPWLTEAELKAGGPRTSFHPIIQHGRRKWNQRYHVMGQEQTEAHSQYPQTAVLLPLGYGQSLDKRIMACDPFYALTEIFRLCAAAEQQLLGLLKETIGQDTDFRSLRKKDPTLANLLYCRGILDAHSERLNGTVGWIRRYRSRHSLQDVIEDKSLRAEAELASDDVLSDFEHLLKMADTLSERCNTGMTVILNNVMLEENRQAILQARRVARLTFIAFVFVPLSFTTSLFGMNVSQLGTGPVSIAVWAAVSTSVVIVTSLMYFFDGSTAASACDNAMAMLGQWSLPWRERRSKDSLDDSVEMV